MLRVIFSKKGKPVPKFPVQYYVNTNNYKHAENLARIELERENIDASRYDQVLIVDINVIEP